MELSPEMIKMIASQGIFAILFVWLLYGERKDSKEREDRLMVQLEKNSTVYENVISAVNALRELIISNKSKEDNN
ncbi:hypothetical protein SDC9_15177 [bioreactor metagenome]|uniref:Bacteriocin UviB n=1 Tax=bioreactor metagenome TaxID=1076179 RepID=A0A644TR76_9ZZZZ|nr:BhlA/UviB family holin-like peptide [Desulfitobacterium hafniense]MEA5023929.1 BhlA/UviB family holin-like peptide [Desulfitobacterium hafniense]